MAMDMNDSGIPFHRIRALQELYFAWMLDEMNAFQAADRLLELFDGDLLPVMIRERVEQSFADWRSVRTAVSESHRRKLYAQAFGAAGGEGAALSNRHFTDLWTRFLSAASAFEGQDAPPAALEKQVHAVIGLLSHPEVQTARVTVVRAKVRQLLTSSVAYRALPEEKREQIARDTASIAAEFLAAVDFPDFVAELITGTFGAVVNASIRQMEEYAKLVHDIARLAEANLSDSELEDRLLKRVGARRRLAQSRQQLLSTMVLMGINRVVSDDCGGP